MIAHELKGLVIGGCLDQDPVSRPREKRADEVQRRRRAGRQHHSRAFKLQAFVAGRAADYKVPKKILFMDEIPKGATGKLQRIGLAQKLGLGG